MKTIDFTTKKSYRKDVLQFAAKEYGTEPEYLWKSSPGSAVLRHKDNKKWYALIMDVSKNKLGLLDDGLVDIVNIKCDPALLGSLQTQKGFLPAYHMNKGCWITILLDGTVDIKTIFSLISMSFDCTESRKNKKKPQRSGTYEWIVPANPKYFDIEKAFSEKDTLLWKQSSNISVGDIIYLYVAAPVSAIQYQCKAIEVDIPYEYDDGKICISRAMKIQLLHSFNKTDLPLSLLKEYGVLSIRGTRSVPNSLSHQIHGLCHHSASKMEPE